MLIKQKKKWNLHEIDKQRRSWISLKSCFCRYVLWFRCKACFKVFPIFQIHLCNSYLGFSLPYLVWLFLWFTKQRFLWFTKQRRIQNLAKHLNWSFFAKIVNDWKSFNLDSLQCSEYASTEYKVNYLLMPTIC